MARRTVRDAVMLDFVSHRVVAQSSCVEAQLCATDAGYLATWWYEWSH